MSKAGSEPQKTMKKASKDQDSFYVDAEERLETLRGPKEEEAVSAALLPSVHRRDFMKLFSVGAAASAAACVRRPAEKIIPYASQPIDYTPGKPFHYATTCGGCAAGCGMMVKTRDGRPTKIEGNKEHPLNRGGMCALGQAEIQGLYHPERLDGPMQRTGAAWQKTEWQKALKTIAAKLKTSKKVGIITRGSTGSRHKFFREVLVRLGAKESNLYTWEANALYSTVGRAHKLAFGHETIPRYRFSKAEVVVAIGSDFLVSGLSPVEHSKDFARRRGSTRRSYLAQFESHTTLTGAKADDRYVIPPGFELTVALLLLRSLYENQASKGSSSTRSEIEKILAEHREKLEKAYAQLNFSRNDFDALATKVLAKPTIIIAGSGANFDSNASLLQLAVILCNELAGSYGETLHIDNMWVNSPVRSGDLKRFVADAPDLDALFVIDTDPVFSAPSQWQVKEAIARIATVVSIQPFPVDTGKLAHFALPSHHNLEAWGDEHPNAGLWSLRQPTVRPTRHSWQAEDIMLWLLAYVDKPLPFKNYHAYLQRQMEAVYDLVKPSIPFPVFMKVVQRTGFTLKLTKRSRSFVTSVSKYFSKLKEPASGLVLMTYLDHRLVDGRGAHLPVLQEIGDALTSIAWDTWVALNPHTMHKMGIRRNELLTIKGPGGVVEAAAYPLPGLHPNSVVIPRGNGHTDDRSTISNNNGVNPLAAIGYDLDPLTEEPVSSGQRVSIATTKRWHRLAAMQKADDDLQGRNDIIKTMSLDRLQHKKRLKKSLDDVPDLFPKLESAQYRWGMSVDLDKCSGCGACMAACAIENNIPQVGREQILMGREMHWIRLDRYFRKDLNEPEISVQPVMCQQCNHAPCEAVCPVLATTHDPEGINSMTYNRCVGTRYCANACPYKVRRFNWWTYRWGEIGNKERDRNPRPTNPDVTVRTKGVMEKCSFCLQRLHEVKNKAKLAKRHVYDGEVKTACQQTCPMDAIKFGNLNDSTSLITKKRSDPRAYLVLGGEPEHGHYGLKTLPNVNYLAKISLKEVASEHGEDKHGGGH